MSKRKKIKEFWDEKVVPNKGKIASRVIKASAVCLLTSPKVALAFNATAASEAAIELAEGYARIADSCLGGKRFGIPLPKSYLERTLCAALILTCGAAAAQGFGNTLTDAACVAMLRNLAQD